MMHHRPTCKHIGDGDPPTVQVRDASQPDISRLNFSLFFQSPPGVSDPHFRVDRPLRYVRKPLLTARRALEVAAAGAGPKGAGEVTRRMLLKRNRWRSKNGFELFIRVSIPPPLSAFAP